MSNHTMNGDPMDDWRFGFEVKSAQIGAAEVGAGFLADFKRQNGPFASDEEMLLHLFYGRAQVEALGREKSIFDGRPTVDAPLMALVKRLSKDGSLKSFKLEKGPLKLDVGLG